MEGREVEDAGNINDLEVFKIIGSQDGKCVLIIKNVLGTDLVEDDSVQLLPKQSEVAS